MASILSFLPADTIVLPIFAPAIRNSYEIHHALVIVQALQDSLELRILVADHDCLGMIQDRIDSVDHQSRYVGNAVEDEVAICANQACQVYIPVKNAQVIAFADEMFDDFDHRTLS